MAILSAANDVVHPPPELMTGKHEYAIARKAFDSYVCADPGYLPVDAAAGMWLAQSDDVTRLDAVGVHLSWVTHSDAAPPGNC